jgi:hypothetical protein
VRLFGRAGCFGCGVNEAIAETRPSAAILAAMAGARSSEQPALREALAMARRRDALDLELAAFEKRLPENPAGCDGRCIPAVLSEIGGTAISEVELRRFRLALLLPYRGDPPPSVSEQRPPGDIALTAGASARR